ncbi:MAG: hypothetical protein QOG52_879 [Frankiaceae bacterium]|jgi:hypothetical protein|nr:hypothetical protein [Frankiaceae bacterium]
MRPPSCPRCSGPVREPGLWSSSWQCDRHGDVLPYHQGPKPSREALDAAMVRSHAPWWSPYPSMIGWTVSGFGHCGDDSRGTRASAICFSGPNPFGGPVDLLFVAEEPGVGIGARFAGLDGMDPGEGVFEAPPDIHIEADGHACPLWRVPSAEDRLAYVGEALGMWLWAVVWPPTAGVLLLDDLRLADVRDSRPAREALVCGAPSPHMTISV